MIDNNQLDRIVIEHDGKAGDRLAGDVYKYLGRFVSYPSRHAHIAHVLWVFHAHLMEKWESTPRLCFLSPEPASGKTRALEITESLVPNPAIAVNMTAAYLFRKVGEGGATILFDEIDTVFGDAAKGNEEIRGLLNAGHRRGAVAGRCVVEGKTVRTEEIPAFAPVALAGLGWLPETITSRAVIIKMRRRRDGEAVEPYRRRVHVPEGERLRDRIGQYCRSVSLNGWPDMTPLEDRAADVWESLFAIADAIGGDWPKQVREAAVALIDDAHDREPSQGIRLLSDLRVIFEEIDRDKLPTKVILSRLCEMSEAPWATVLRGHPLDDRGLATRLRKYNVKSGNIRTENGVVRGYQRGDLADAWSRYLPVSPGKSTTSATAPIDDEKPHSATLKNGNVFNGKTEPKIMAEDVADPVADVASVAHFWREGEKPSGDVDLLDIPACLDRRPKCGHCGKPGRLSAVVIDGVEAQLHRECEAAWAATQVAA